MNIIRSANRRFFTALAFFTATVLGAHAATNYYIDPASGNDDSAGTAVSTAWKTFRNVFSYRSDKIDALPYKAHLIKLGPGDVVFVMDGTISQIYRPGSSGAANVTGTPALMYFRGVNGSADAPIKISAYTGAKPVLDPQYQGQGIVIYEANYLEISGLTIRNAGDATREAGGLSANTARNIKLHDLEIRDTDGTDNNNISGIHLLNVYDAEIYNCVVHDNYDRTAVDTGGITTANSTNMVFFQGGNIAVHDCLIYQTQAPLSGNNTGAGIKYKAASGDPAAYFHVYRNVFRNCKFFPVMSGTGNTTVDHNIFIEGSRGVSFLDCANYTRLMNEVVEYNTFYNLQYANDPAVVGSAFEFYPTLDWNSRGYPGSVSNIVFRNNIVQDSGSYSAEHTPVYMYGYISDDLYNASIAEMHVDHNCYYNTAGFAQQFSVAYSVNSGVGAGPLGGIYNWTQWRALTWTNPGTGQPQALNFDTNSTTANPQFIVVDTALAAYNPTSNAFRPQAGSPAVNMGAYAALTGDSEAPIVPANLAASATTATSTTLTWSASTDNVGVTGYRIYRNGTQVGTTTATTYTDTGLTTGTTYSYQVVAYDAAGNVSGYSAALSVIAHDETYTSYAAWRTANFTGSDLSNDAISGPNADPDGAGISNLERYAFGLAARGPVAAATTVSLVADAGQNYLAVSFNRKGYAPGLSYVVQSSTDLVTWTDLQPVAPGYPKAQQIRDLAATSTVTRRFLRVQITQTLPIDDAPQR